MTICLAKSCSFGSAFRKQLSVYVFSYLPFGYKGRLWDLIVSVPDHCLSFYLDLDACKCAIFFSAIAIAGSCFTVTVTVSGLDTSLNFLVGLRVLLFSDLYIGK